MKLFSLLYEKVISWSNHQHACKYLACVSFAESSFFPIPPDVMLISMGLAQPKSAWRYAFIATVASVLGGILGYCLGVFFSSHVFHFMQVWGYEPTFLKVKQWFLAYGIWIVFLAGFSPIPYKIFTVTAGIMYMPIVPFVFVSLLSRGLRFFLVSAAMYFWGDALHSKLKCHIERLGYLAIFISLIAYIGYHLLH